MKLKTVLALSLGIVLTASLAQADLVYREIFSATSADASNLQSLTNSAWDSRWSTTATTNYYNQQAIVAGGPTPNLAPTNSFPYNGTNAGRTFQLATYTGYVDANQPFIIWTSEYNPTLAPGIEVTEARFWERHSTPSGSTLTHDTFRFVLQIGGAWYVTDQSTALTGASSNSGTDGIWSEQSINLTNATWRTLSFTPGTTLTAPGSSVGLPTSGTVTSFGFYEPALVTPYSNFLRFDSIELYMIPEPSSLMLLALGGLLLARRR